MSDDYSIRRDRLQQSLQTDLDRILVSEPVNVSYLTGFSGDSSYLLISKDKTLLISDGRYTTQIQDECPELEYHIWPPSKNIYQATGEILNKSGLSNLACDAGHSTLADVESLSENTPGIGSKEETGGVAYFHISRRFKGGCHEWHCRMPPLELWQRAFEKGYDRYRI